MASIETEFKRAFCEKTKAEFIKKDKNTDKEATQKAVARWETLVADQKEYQRKFKAYKASVEKKRKAAESGDEPAAPAPKRSVNPQRHASVVAPETGGDNKFRVNYTELGVPFFVNMRTGTPQWNMPENMLKQFLGADFMQQMTLGAPGKRKGKRGDRASGPRKLHGYQMFVKEFKREDGEALNNRERMKLCAEAWNKLDEEEKAEWKSKSVEYNERQAMEIDGDAGKASASGAEKGKASSSKPAAAKSAKKSKPEPPKEQVVKSDGDGDWDFL